MITMPMTRMKHDLLTSKYTRVYHEQGFKHNAPNHFEVVTVIDIDEDGGEQLETLAKIHFQEGPIKECGINGVANEDVLAMVIHRLEHFNRSGYSSRENDMAIAKLEEALLWLRKRTMGRESRGVEGTGVI